MVHEGVVGLQREQLTNSHNDTHTHSSLVPRRSKKNRREHLVSCLCMHKQFRYILRTIHRGRQAELTDNNMEKYSVKETITIRSNTMQNCRFQVLDDYVPLVPFQKWMQGMNANGKNSYMCSNELATSVGSHTNTT